MRQWILLALHHPCQYKKKHQKHHLLLVMVMFQWSFTKHLNHQILSGKIYTPYHCKFLWHRWELVSWLIGLLVCNAPRIVQYDLSYLLQTLHKSRLDSVITSGRVVMEVTIGRGDLQFNVDCEPWWGPSTLQLWQSWKFASASRKICTQTWSGRKTKTMWIRVLSWDQ